MSGKHRDRPGEIPGMVFVASSQDSAADRGIVLRIAECGRRVIWQDLCPHCCDEYNLGDHGTCRPP